MNAEILTASAAADLFKKGGMPADEDAAATAIATHAADYLAGKVWFRLMDEKAALSFLDTGDTAQLGSLFKSLKKAVKKVAPLAVGLAAGIATANPGVGIAAMNATSSLTASKVKGTAAFSADPLQVTPAGYPVAYPAGYVPPTPTIAGIPQTYVMAGAGVVLLMLLLRR